jgi:hypothetical protein
MRKIHREEQRKRGCFYCADKVTAHVSEDGKDIKTHCPHDKCPYEVLDRYESYEDYLKATSKDTLKNVLKSLGL